MLYKLILYKELNTISDPSLPHDLLLQKITTLHQQLFNENGVYECERKEYWKEVMASLANTVNQSHEPKIVLKIMSLIDAIFQTLSWSVNELVLQIYTKALTSCIKISANNKTLTTKILRIISSKPRGISASSLNIPVSRITLLMAITIQAPNGNYLLNDVISSIKQILCHTTHTTNMHLCLSYYERLINHFLSKKPQYFGLFATAILDMATELAGNIETFQECLAVFFNLIANPQDISRLSSTEKAIVNNFFNTQPIEHYQVQGYWTAWQYKTTITSFRQPPQPFPTKNSPNSNPTRISFPATLKHNANILGRTIFSSSLALKFQKEGELLKELVHETQVNKWLQKNHENLELQSSPIPCHHSDQPDLVSIPVNQIPKSILQELQAVAKTGNYKLAIKENQLTAICYPVNKNIFQGYFTYLNAPQITPKKFLEASFTALHDLATLAQYGIFHTAIIDLFHNQTHTRRFHFNDDALHLLVQGHWGLEGPGRLHSARQGTQYPNYRLSGLADSAEMGHTSDQFVTGQLGKYPCLLSTNQQKNTAIAATYLGQYLLSWVFMFVSHLVKNQGLNKNTWKSKKIPKHAKTIQEIFNYTYKTFAHNPSKLALANKQVNWQLLMAQLCYFMTRAYHGGVSIGQIPQSLRSQSTHMELQKSKSWGLIHIKLIKQLTQNNEELLKHIIDQYLTRIFDDHRITDTYQVDASLTKCEFKQDPKIQDLTKGHKKTRQQLAKLLLKHKTGWRLDGLHEDLGYFDGPNPLTELMKALNIFSTYMTQDFSNNKLK